LTLELYLKRGEYIDILLGVNAEESWAWAWAWMVEISGLQFRRTPAWWESMWGSWSVAGRTAGSATSQPLVLLSSIVFGLTRLFLPWGVRQTSVDSELLSVLFSSSRALHLHWFSIWTDRSPDWFRLLSHCLGRTSRHRRSDRNRPALFLI